MTVCRSDSLQPPRSADTTFWRGCTPSNRSLFWLEHPEESRHRIIKLIDDAFLHRNDRVVSDADVFRANFRAAFGDVAITEAVVVLQIRDAVFGIERMHFQRSGVHQEAGADELVMLVMVAQHMANILAEKTLDALSEFLNAINVFLHHCPRSVGVIWFSWLEWFDLLLDAEVPTDVGHKISNRWE